MIRRWAAPLLLAICCATVVIATLEPYGVTFDENHYFRAGTSYLNWLRDPSLKTIDRQWYRTHEHPPLAMVAGGLTRFLFRDTLGWTGQIVGHRVSTGLFVFAMTFMLYCFTRKLYGELAAALATLGLFVMPRVFFHAHLGTLDYPMMTLWFAVIYSFWLGIQSQAWIYVAASLVGLALLTKLNAAFLAIPITLWWVMDRGPEFLRRWREKDQPFRSLASSLRRKALPLLIIPPILLFALWPWLWLHPLVRIGEYIGFHAHHFHSKVFYLGETFSELPWHYPFVMTAATTPLLLLGFFVIGALRIRSHGAERATAFLLFNALFPLVIIAFPGVPKYDGVRLFLTAFPFISILAALGARWIILRPPSRWWRTGLAVSCLLLLLWNAAWPLRRDHPYQFAYYNRAVGGLAGASKYFEVDYWGSSYGSLLPWIDSHIDSRFWLRFGRLRSRFYVPDGLVESTIKLGSEEDSEYLILLNRRGLFDSTIWRYVRTQRPVHSVKLGETPLVSVYRVNP